MSFFASPVPRHRFFFKSAFVVNKKKGVCSYHGGRLNSFSPMAASLQRFRLRASVRPRLPCIPRRTHAYCVAARTQASCVAARATVLALAAGAWRHRKQPALCEPPPPPPPLPPLETALAPVASEQPLPLARRLARVAFYALRAAYLWLVFSPLLLSSPLAFWQKRFPQLEEVWWSWCIATLERTGALAIKLAQWASSRPDLFSSRVCGRLQHLQDHTQPHSLEATEAALDAAFGPGWRSVLRIAPHPVGSGCIAQVRPRRESCGRRLRRRREDPCKERRGRVAGGGVSELACRCTAASSCGMASGGRWRSRCCTRRLGRRASAPRSFQEPSRNCPGAFLQVGRYIRADGALLRLVCGGLQRLPRVRWLNPGGGGGSRPSTRSEQSPLHLLCGCESGKTSEECTEMRMREISARSRVGWRARRDERGVHRDAPPPARLAAQEESRFAPLAGAHLPATPRPDASASRSEADNLRRFRANFARAGGGAPPVDFPDPVGGYVARPALCRVVRGEVGGGPEPDAFP